jgi:hypothetical protein
VTLWLPRCFVQTVFDQARISSCCVFFQTHRRVSRNIT